MGKTYRHRRRETVFDPLYTPKSRHKCYSRWKGHGWNKKQAVTQTRTASREFISKCYKDISYNDSHLIRISWDPVMSEEEQLKYGAWW